MIIKPITSLAEHELKQLHEFIKSNEEKILPYHLLEYNRLMDNVFGYRNFSFVAFDENKDIIGYLPQWQKGKIIESIPWRDKGGPLGSHGSVITAFIEETKQIIERNKLKGFIWKDSESELLNQYQYFINIDIDLGEFDTETYWASLASKVRYEIKSARRNDLIFQLEKKPSHVIDDFYRIFRENRKRLGVPVYSKQLFIEHFSTIPPENIKLFSVYKDNTILCSLILLHTRHKAIEAYAALSADARRLKANYLLLYQVILYCIDKNIRYFDFGADSPLQEKLIFYKMKWLGKKRKITSAVYGEVSETDHNTKQYEIAKTIITKMPDTVYELFSKVVVR